MSNEQQQELPAARDGSPLVAVGPAAQHPPFHHHTIPPGCRRGRFLRPRAPRKAPLSGPFRLRGGPSGGRVWTAPGSRAPRPSGRLWGRGPLAPRPQPRSRPELLPGRAEAPRPRPRPRRDPALRLQQRPGASRRTPGPAPPPSLPPRPALRAAARP